MSPQAITLTYTLYLAIAPNAIIQTPAFNGNKSVLSWLPPSGNIPTAFYYFKVCHTASYISD